MVSAYRVADITRAQVDRAFALVHAADARTELSDWRRTCSDVLSAERGEAASQRLLVCENANGYLKGLCLVRRRADPEACVLDVPLHVVLTVADEEGVRQALRESLQALASEAGCTLMPIEE
ncbi:hypothetical protein J2858_002777 [Neorhizobium galegae]|uniref:hypothetical protein n=1 Tax=Rhizobium/Agrobacterium group TaxID=227290 RepID=UPI001AE215DA|nr:hypothetical protein [Neorhizobium galegae]MBP2549844.1 hypothetical protein [Neorhizobium galegae]